MRSIRGSGYASDVHVGHSLDRMTHRTVRRDKGVVPVTVSPSDGPYEMRREEQEAMRGMMVPMRSAEDS